MDVKNIEMNVANPYEVMRITKEVTEKMEGNQIDGIEVSYHQIEDEVKRVEKSIALEIISLENNFLDEGVIKVMTKGMLLDKEHLKTQITFKFTKDYIYLIIFDTLMGMDKQCYGKFNRQGELVEYLAHKDMFRNVMLLDILGGGEVKNYTTENFFRNSLSVLIIVNRLATTRQEVLKEKSRRVVNQPGKKKKKSKGSKKVKLIRTYTLYLSNETEIKESIDKRDYNRQLECWSVKGFPRKYKSGKVVWIKPHVRGKGKKEGKTYQI